MREGEKQVNAICNGGAITLRIRNRLTADELPYSTRIPMGTDGKITEQAAPVEGPRIRLN